jgi:hypothetical protein
MARNDQVTRQWHLLRRLESSRGATLQELVDSTPADFPKNPRTIRRGTLSHRSLPLAPGRADVCR